MKFAVKKANGEQGTMITKCIILLFISDLISVTARSYSNYTLYSIMPRSNQALNYLKSLETMYIFEFWTMPVAINKSVDILIGPEGKDLFLTQMKAKNFKYRITMEDVQSVINKQKVKHYIRRQMNSFNWKSYYRLGDIYNWLKDVEREYPGEVSLIEIGKTYEGREILAVKVRLKNTNIRSKVIVEGGIHAREWIAPAFVLYLLNEVVTQGHKDRGIWHDLARTYEWYFIPVLNPDGYEYTHTTDRLWRKNRRDGFGVDINRNFDISFGTTGVSFETNSAEYCGERAFTESESSALANFLRSLEGPIEYYLAFHAYGQYMIIPYAHSKVHLANYDEVAELLRGAALRINQIFWTRYNIGTAFDTVGYTTSGVSGCYAKAVYDIRYVVTFELRDRGRYGFVLPPQLILPTCLETLDGVEYILTPRHAFQALRHEDNFSAQTALRSTATVVHACVILIVFCRFSNSVIGWCF